jgi:transcriptional regulator with XRE-family HTH domain
MTTTTEIVEIPLSEVGLDPLFQVRAIDPDEVRRLVENWTPEQCEPLWVRPWPQNDTRPRPVGCEHAAYQVASGWTRTTAARELGLATLPAVVLGLNDLDFRAWAVEGNAFHGKRMTAEEQRIQVQMLAKGRMSQRDIAKKTGIHQSTVSRLLSGRDSNESRKAMRTHQPSGDSDILPGLPDGWRTEAVNLDAQRLAEITGRLNKALNFGDLTATVPPGEAAAWLAQQSPAMRQILAGRFEQIALWWQGISACARLAGVAGGATAGAGEEVAQGVAHDPHKA